MKPVDLSEILDLTAYEKARPEFLKKIIDLKTPRRISVGDRLTFIFENRETVIFQIQEMLRAERTVDDQQIQSEISIYNELIPQKQELSATLMIEIPSGEHIQSELNRLVGIDEHVILQIDEDSLRAQFDSKQFEEEKISAVQYVRFNLSSKLCEKFLDTSSTVAIQIDHPNYKARTEIVGMSRASLSNDLLTP
tara:strand:- start:5940 stop:6521 length:582 start_codon:yes stop_codon:yes gene_type:complete